MWFATIWVTLSYVLAFMGRTEIAETLSGDVVKIVIATTLGYLLKAFFETYCEKKNELKERELGLGSKEKVEEPKVNTPPQEETDDFRGE